MSVIVIDDQTPEDVAMMAALYSRSSSSVVTHLEKVKKTGSGKFMQSYYVDYGHESIADCGSTTIFIENVSILAAKAIQDWPLYSGQETSTRYIDMSRQEITDPLGSTKSKEILDNWMDFYNSSNLELTNHLKEIYPDKGTTKQETNIYNKAIAARCFDILRAFLPAGINTQLAWHTNLRQASNKLATLSHHPDPVIRNLGNQIHEALVKRYPNSFSHKKYEETEKYLDMTENSYTYFNNPRVKQTTCSTSIRNDELELYRDIIESRPPKTSLPRFLNDFGHLKFNFMLDFGSFRDIQRHRSGTCRMPYLTTNHGFHQWYLDQLPQGLRQKAVELIEHQTKKILELQTDCVTRQYYIPLGFLVACQMTFGLPGAVYTIELRSANTVHPTLRSLAHEMKTVVSSLLPSLTWHCDDSPDQWSIKRGNQDIVERVG